MGFHEELPRKGRDILRTEDHHLTATPTRSLKSWSKHVAWTNKQTVDLKQAFFCNNFSNHPNSNLVSDQSFPYSQLQCATAFKTTSKQIIPHYKIKICEMYFLFFSMKTKFFIQQKFHLATTVHLFDYFELHCIKYISNQNSIDFYFIKIILKHFLFTLE